MVLLTAFIVSVVTSFVLYNQCRLWCINEMHVNKNFSKLKMDLSKTLIGQHLALNIVPKILEEHFNNPNPKRALSMLFEGWTGSGKSFVVQKIIRNLFFHSSSSFDALNSYQGHCFLRVYTPTRDFPHAHKHSYYIDQLNSEITQLAKQCPRSLVVFDEVENLQPRLLDVISPYLNSEGALHGGVDVRRMTFILLSNAAAKWINDAMLKLINREASGVARETISLRDIEAEISRGHFKSNSGLKNSVLLTRNMISQFVPFLPLETRHVRSCVRQALSDWKHSDKNNGRPTTTKSIENWTVIENYVINELDIDNGFSRSGCKRVDDKIRQWRSLNEDD